MSVLALHELHGGLQGRFTELSGQEAVANYGDVPGEYAALGSSAGVLDLSFRGRVCVVGADRLKFLNGQVTNNVKDLAVGQGCYAALISAKGKMQSDLNIFCLGDELLLDFEPGLSPVVQERLQKYIIADDVELVDVADQYGLLCVQGPRAGEVVAALELDWQLPGVPLSQATVSNETLGQLYLMNHSRIGREGYDLFVPTASLGAVADKLIASARAVGGGACGWEALEMKRIEAGIPRFGVDMDEANLPPEAGLDARAISYSKGCYIGQEVIARLRTYGQVAKALRGLRLADDLKILPVKGDKLFKGDKEVGFVTSALASPGLRANVALGYVRREANQPGTELTLVTGTCASSARVVELPFAG